MRRRLLTYAMILAVAAAAGQNTLIPSVSNYHLTWTTLNPAFSGFRDAMSVSSLYRSGLYGGVGPTDMQLNVHTPTGNPKVGLGGVVAYNTSPPDQQLYSVMTTYAYRLYLGNGRLSFGLSAGVYGISNDMTGITVRDPGDPNFATEPYRKWFPNFGTGVLYYTEAFFVGISVPELLSVPGYSQGIGTFDVKQHRVILSGAYLFDFSEAFRLKPSLMIDYNQASTSFKASINAGFMDSRFFIGGAYDYPNYAIALFNFQVNPQWMVGYAYTMATGAFRTALGGSHEVVLRWEFRPVIKTYDDDPFYF